MDTYDPQAIETKWQQALGGRERLPHAERRARRRQRVLRPRDAPVPVRDAARRPGAQLHAGRRPRALPPPQRQARHAADGLRLVRAERRERRDPGRRPSAGHHPRQHRADPRADEADGLGDRLGPRGRQPRARVLPLDAVALPAVLEGRPGAPQGGAGEVVPEGSDRARERAGDRRALRALRHGGRGEDARAVVLPLHDVRGRAARRDGAARVAGPSACSRCSGTGSAAPRGPRSCSVSRSSTSTSRSSRPAPTRSSARRSSSSRPSTRSSRSSSRARRSEREVLDYVRRTAARSFAEREEKEKDGVFTGRFATNPANGAAPADLGRRLRADGVRLRARSWPCPRTTTATSSSRRSTTCRFSRSSRLRTAARSSCRTSRSPTEAVLVNSGAVLRAAGARRRAARSSRGSASMAAVALPSAIACATGCSRGSATGALRSPSCTATQCGIVPVPEEELPVLLPEIEDYAPKGKSPLESAEDWIRVPVPAVRGEGAARGRHDGHVRRLVLVLPALLRPAQRPRRRSTVRASTSGARSTSTSAASSTRSCICSTRATSSRC